MEGCRGEKSGVTRVGKGCRVRKMELLEYQIGFERERKISVFEVRRHVRWGKWRYLRCVGLSE